MIFSDIRHKNHKLLYVISRAVSRRVKFETISAEISRVHEPITGAFKMSAKPQQQTNEWCRISQLKMNLGMETT